MKHTSSQGNIDNRQSQPVSQERIAVLLVSAEFLDSEFLSHELKMLADAHRDKRLRILWVAVRPSLWQETALAAYELTNDAANPLSTLSDVDTALAQICTYIKHAIVPGPAYILGGPRHNPYLGLSAFQVEESHLFFGREEVTQQLCKNFHVLFDQPGSTRLLTILGPSGSGKSSIARAGLLAALQRSSVAGAQPLRIAVLKPGASPIESLARALVPLLPRETALLPASRAIAIEQLLRNAAAPGQGLRRFADDLPQIDHCPLLLFVDGQVQSRRYAYMSAYCLVPCVVTSRTSIQVASSFRPSQTLCGVPTQRAG